MLAIRKNDLKGGFFIELNCVVYTIEDTQFGFRLESKAATTMSY